MVELEFNLILFKFIILFFYKNIIIIILFLLYYLFSKRFYGEMDLDLICNFIFYIDIYVR